ncbi:MAG: malto-oligosyltrehalose trehalohydrolase [Desulfuromonas sp.]
MKRCHRMPFGAELQHDGRVRFRLWAPQAAQVELSLEGEGQALLLPLRPEGDGWYELVTDTASNGSHYRYRIDGGLWVPDPASRFQPQDVHGPSQVVDPCSWEWDALGWHGLPWEQVIVYELHLGTFTAVGSFAAAQECLPYLQKLGITAIELMPVAAFPGQRNWGYDGVLPFAPESSYGPPEALKAFIQHAHRLELMVFLDVVYNHFGPEGNYLSAYAPDFFSPRHHTPWGAAFNFDGPECHTVRQFFIHNALYWLEEYQFDGLRLDAVHALLDDSTPDILEELAAVVHCGPGRERHVHLMLENDHNAAGYLRQTGKGRPPSYVAQWNDDIHHAFHILLTGESDGYYLDYTKRPSWHLGRCLTEGFSYQGEFSEWRGHRRGEACRDLPLTAFIAFLQNHDQVGNRAFGERLSTLTATEALRAAVAVLLLCPLIPLLFMGDEFATPQPFLYFSHLSPELADAVRNGRRQEFARFALFADPALRETIPDPNDIETFRRSTLDWSLLALPEHQSWLTFYRALIALRKREIIPRLAHMTKGSGRAEFQLLGQTGLLVQWILGDGSQLRLLTNLGDQAQAVTQVRLPPGELLYMQPETLPTELAAGRLPPWMVAWTLEGEMA